MKFLETNIPGVFELDLFHLIDERGSFVKTFHQKSFEDMGLETRFDESFYSVNKKGVIRGMHFQLPPDDHAKLVYCTSGSLIDVVLDIRKESPTYGTFAEIKLSADNFKAAYLPKGVAHGFAVLEDNTCMVYLTSTMHSPSKDAGIRWDSFGYPWPFEIALNSERDQNFPAFSEFDSPF